MGAPRSTGAHEVIRVAGLTRRFGSLLAIDGLDLAVGAGEIYGLLGANGAGKSTALKLMVGLLEPTAGRIWLAGHDLSSAPIAARASLGYLADRTPLYERLTGREFLRFLAQMRALDRPTSERRIAALLVTLDLDRHAERPCGDYSFGMKRKLGVAGALIHDPPLLILDEPLRGLDPPGAQRLRSLLLSLARGGTAILLSTHDLGTAETLCDRIGILHDGRLLAEGSAPVLMARGPAPTLEAAFLRLIDRPGEP